MTLGRKRHDKAAADAVDPAAGTAVPVATGETVGGPEAPPAAGSAVVEPLEQALVRLERELADWKDRALRSAADLENFRKRAVREREESWNRGQGEVLAKVLDVVDDLARVAHLDPAQTTAEALHEGMGLVERKFLRVLETAGLERIDPAGQPFDPHSHEAVATFPAPSAEADHTVAAVYAHGYRLRGALLRPARVAVFTWSAPAAAPLPGGDGDGGAAGAGSAN
ncbi:MAG: nucleotide exchange factor GrpE [Gemmatimonadetes bacterium GWC2_71_9]|nr:MAG: nucleotide exchange factor GrpE [Gemmatimonadetes bacterium GWC2_71_9]OGT95431.1 MAG: nucleotide exchange factor GrpE [Gemmatimonadetes bacterium RIFCSPLOWO2_02_FULL_71_11]